MTQPFISSTPDLANYLRADLTDDELAVIAVDAACEVVRGYIRQHVNLVLDDEVLLDGNNKDAILLPELPVLAVTDVTTTEDDGTDQLILTEGVEFRLGDGGILWRIDLGSWPWGHRNIAVTYDHGYGVEEPGSGDDWEAVPSDMRLVALEVAAGVYNSGLTGTGGTGVGITSETIGSYSYTLGEASGGSASLVAGLSVTHQRRLDRYRLRGVV